MKTMRWLALLWLLASSLAPVAGADEISVAVAANFTAPMKQIGAGFEQTTGHQLLLSYGATGKFYAQIQNGAPFDVLLASDSATPDKLIQDQLALSGSQFTYAIGALVLWSGKPGLVDSQAKVLRSGGFDHIALANPKLAPYGAAAVQTLKALGLYESLQAKFVMGENIGQTYQFVSSGNAELGFVALSQVLADGKISGSFWLVPAHLYAPIRQNAIILRHGQHKPAVQALVDYLKSDPARAVMQSFGYQLP